MASLNSSSTTTAAYAFPSGLLPDLLAVSLTGVNVLRPLYGASGELEDFALEYLNPAAQRMTGLPEQPGGTARSRFPALFTNGVFAFYRRVFETGEADRYDVNYQADGFDNYFHVAARRSGELLVVSFTDTSDQDRSPVEQTLRQSQAAEQLARREAEHQRNELQRYIEQAPVAVVLYRGPEHRVAVANAAALAIWDRTWAQVQHRPVFEVLPEAAQPHVVAFFHRVFTTGEPYVAHELPTIINRHGQPETVYWNFVFQPERQPDGHITGIITIGTEVTEQVLARQQLERLNEELELRVTARSAEARTALFEAEQQREQLRQQQALLGQILSQVPAAIAALKGPEHRYTFFNEPYQALSANRTSLGRTVAEVFPEVEEQGFVALLDQVYRTGRPFVGTDTPAMLHDRATGQAEQRYVDFVYQPLFDGQQRPHGILAFIVDVTEKVQARKQADTLQAAMLAVVQRQAQERENVYQLFEQAPAAICLLREPDHRIDYLNPAYQALFPGQQLRGRTLAVVQADAPELVRLLDGIYQLGEAQSRLGVPVVIPPADGQPAQTRYFDFTYQAYREEGSIAGISIFGFDVTEQVLAHRQIAVLNEELRATNNRLTRTNTDLDTFVYTASHDLKAPITNVEGILQALRETLPPAVLQDDAVAHLFGLLDNTVSRFQTTIHQLTDLSRLQQTYNEPAESLLLPPVVADVLTDLAPAIAAAAAQVHEAVPADLRVSFAPASLRSVVYNLLSNAVKYRAPERPAQVWLTAERQPAAVVLTVRDNGLGLTQTQQTRLFGVFQRLHTHVEGTGVGLYMIKRLIENAGASITVTSTLGVGSTFTVTFPT